MLYSDFRRKHARPTIANVGIESVLDDVVVR